MNSGGAPNGVLGENESPQARQWAVVLAGGSGSRLEPLTSRYMGGHVPKQYCSLFGDRSLLGDALERAQQFTARERIVTIVASNHRPYWERDLQGMDPRNVIVQPLNRGTAAGVLLPLLEIATRDPAAHVTLLPADHFFTHEDLLVRAIRDAQRIVARSTDRLVLVGMKPEDAESDYGWILPAGHVDGGLRVRRFVEKPTRAEAARLLRQGAVWNGFYLTASVQALLGLFMERAPGLLAALRAADAQQGLGEIYESMPPSDFCRDLLAGYEEHLDLVVAPECGWTDLGTPARVTRCARSYEQRLGTPGQGLAAAALRTWAAHGE
jgi:mannose-1-phosphate guanylyltransferase